MEAIASCECPGGCEGSGGFEGCSCWEAASAMAVSDWPGAAESTVEISGPICEVASAQGFAVWLAEAETFSAWFREVVSAVDNSGWNSEAVSTATVSD